MFDLPGLTPLFTFVSTILHLYISLAITVGVGIQIWLIKRFLDHETRISKMEGKANGEQ